jgi:hypothetical protein
MFKDEDGLEEPIRNLEAASLVKLIEKDDKLGISLHHNVQDEVSSYTKYHSNQAIDKNALILRLSTALNKLIPEVTQIPDEKWEIAGQYASQATKILKLLSVVKDNKNSLEAMEILYDKLACYQDYVICNYPKSLEYYLLRLNLLEKLYPKDLYPNGHLLIAIQYHNLALIYENIGNLEQAQKYCEHSLAMKKLVNPEDLESIAVTKLSLVTIYFQQEKFNECLKLELEVFDVWKKLSDGKPNLHIVDILARIGAVHDALEHNKQALEYKLKAFKILLGLPQDQDTKFLKASLLGSIANTYNLLDNNQLSFNYYKLSLKEYKEIYGERDNPKISELLFSLGDSLVWLGRLQEASEMYERSYKMSERIFGTEDKNTKDKLNECQKLKSYIAKYFNNVEHKLEQTRFIEKIKDLTKQTQLNKNLQLVIEEFKEDKLKNILGTLYSANNTAESAKLFMLNTAKALGFKAINEAINLDTNSNGINLILEFTKTYPKTVNSVVKYYPNFFSSELVKENCTELLNSLDYDVEDNLTLSISNTGSEFLYHSNAQLNNLYVEEYQELPTEMFSYNSLGNNSGSYNDVIN